MSLGCGVHLNLLEFSISYVLLVVVFILWAPVVRIFTIVFFIILCGSLVEWGTGYTNIFCVVDPFPLLILNMRLVVSLNTRLIYLSMISRIVGIWLLWWLLHKNRLVLASRLKYWLDWHMRRLRIIWSVIHVGLSIILSVLWLTIGWFRALAVLCFLC